MTSMPACVPVPRNDDAPPLAAHRAQRHVDGAAQRLGVAALHRAEHRRLQDQRLAAVHVDVELLALSASVRCASFAPVSIHVSLAPV